MKKTVLMISALFLMAWAMYRTSGGRASSATAERAPASEPSTPIAIEPTPAKPAAEVAPAQERATQADVPPEVQSVAKRDKRPHGQTKDAAQARAELERTGKVLAESIPWLEQRRLEAERAGQDGEARTLAMRIARLSARLKVVEQGTDPDSRL